jgi:serine/threonine-protein kinase HipA
MTSEAGPVFVWLWRPGATEPVVAGRLDPAGAVLTFTYGRSYLARARRRTRGVAG